MKKDVLYSICCLAFSVIIGGAVYEHLNVVPKWSAAPPVSLTMFQGEYGLKPELFWKIIHPVSVLLFVLSLIMHWKSGRRKNLVVVFASYLLILVITFIFFVPELISITTTVISPAANADLTKRAARWEALSIARLVMLSVLAIILFTGLTKGNVRQPITEKG